MIALNRNASFSDLPSVLADLPIAHGQTRSLRRELKTARDARHILLVDDSIETGGSMKAAAALLMDAVKSHQRVTTLAAYASDRDAAVDHYFEVLPQRRVFEWNLMHRPYLANCCFDIDGVLCADPTAEQNDDGSRYEDFLASARVINAPTHEIGHLVTSRLEKYRGHTEDWLRRNNIRWGKLHMLDLPTAEERRRRGIHASFKASVYSQLEDAQLFVESERPQAMAIADQAGKAVLCYATQEVFYPGMNLETARGKLRRVTWKKVSGKLRSLIPT